MGELACEHSEQMTILMSLALDGALNADDQHQLQRHLAGCPSCQAEWESMQRVSALFEDAPMVGPPLGFAVRVERRLEQRSKRHRRLFGGMAVLTSSLPLVGMTVGAVVLIMVGVVVWLWLGSMPAVQQGIGAASQVAAATGLVAKGASLFLLDLLRRFGPPLVLLLGIGLVSLAGMWAWLFLKGPGKSHRNGYV